MNGSVQTSQVSWYIIQIKSQVMSPWYKGQTQLICCFSDVHYKNINDKISQEKSGKIKAIYFLHNNFLNLYWI